MSIVIVGIAIATLMLVVTVAITIIQPNDERYNSGRKPNGAVIISYAIYLLFLTGLIGYVIISNTDPYLIVALLVSWGVSILVGYFIDVAYIRYWIKKKSSLELSDTTEDEKCQM